jgi:hypothetical protein
MSDLLPNRSLNLNEARDDKFFLRLGNIPSAKLLTPTELGDIQKILAHGDDTEFFHLALSATNIPEVSLGELRYETMFTSVTDVDMKIKFGAFNTTITLDNEYLIYKMLVLWLFMIKNPEGFNQFDKSKTYKETSVSAELIVANNFNKPVMAFQFFDLRPLSIPSIPLNYRSDGAPLNLEIPWAYSYFMPRTSSTEPIPFRI